MDRAAERRLYWKTARGGRRGPRKEKMERTNDIRIVAEVPLVAPDDLARRIPMTESANATIVAARKAVKGVLAGADKRFLAVVGPCSIHDPEAAVDYARLLWRGLIIDPTLDGSYDVARGLATARKLLVAINEAGVPAGTEMLDPIVPQYIAELISWGSIGARTTESQTHRELASGLSMPIGFKNSTDGDVQIAVNAILSARQAHSFVGIDGGGNTCILRTKGNEDCHLILRGGRSGPNYRSADIEKALGLLRSSGIVPRIIVDCSHGNSNKKPENQVQVLRNLLDQRSQGEAASEGIAGFMMESNLEPGCQPIPDDHSLLKRGVSLTDPCLGWKETEEILLEAADRLRAIRG
jgi:3-deoxy-7-phosphoheptulonate synthase